MATPPDAARSFILIADTNAFGCSADEPERLFSAGFEKYWLELHQPGDITLCVPQVVFDERCYQMVSSLWKKYGDAKAALARVGSALDRNLSAPELDFESTRTTVRAKLERQLQALANASLVETPFSEINEEALRRIVEAAVWRHAPFKTGEKEQGFRDAIILETVKAIVRRNPHSDISFWSNDERLAVAATADLRHSPNFGVFRSAAPLKQFLTLARTRFSADFLHAVISKATEVFEKLWTEKKIDSYIERKFYLDGLPIDPIREQDPNRIPYIYPLASRRGPGVFSTSRTTLMGVVGHDEFHWRTIVGYRAPYEYFGPAGGRPLDLGGTQTIETLFVFFSVNWIANVADNGAFDVTSFDATHLAQRWLESNEDTGEVLNAFLQADSSARQ
ncbi:MAG: PIN domain-containing protein [Burkholderiales bacterium]